jgi:hypothetical protein
MRALRMMYAGVLIVVALCGLERAAFASDSVTWFSFDQGLVTGLSAGTACTGIAGQTLAGAAGCSDNSITGGFFGNAAVRTIVVAGVPTVPPWHGHVALLEQNFPNPCRLSTVIRFNLPRPAHVTLKLFSVQGQRQATLVDDDRAGGPHEVDCRIGRIPPGMYFYRLEASGTGQPGARFVETKKLVVLR